MHNSFEIMMLYDGKDFLSLANDIRNVVPGLTLDTLKQLFAGERTIEVSEEQFTMLTKLMKLYAPFEVGKA